MQTCPIEVQLSQAEWLALSVASRKAGLMPPAYVRDALLKQLAKHQHLTGSTFE